MHTALTKNYHETHLLTKGLTNKALEAVYMLRLKRLDAIFKESKRIKQLQQEMQLHIE